MLKSQTEEHIVPAPKVYQADDTHYFLNWIAEGTDGRLYNVPSEPGGWNHRSTFSGAKDVLKPVSTQKARAIAHFVGGDRSERGAVTIAEASDFIDIDITPNRTPEASTAW